MHSGIEFYIYYIQNEFISLNALDKKKKDTDFITDRKNLVSS